ncbi:Nramp family divalent metal transporter [Salinimicrobium xinjiangense]|uniref:Nramp family divalent metal transporter n=1 Tax=Salinimicrobium xinjiangense TaxID=438596 RepID=UPI00040C8FD8|nr:Nramp family divalent metal transporter [Salinimicrobium xinjiangense]
MAEKQRRKDLPEAPKGKDRLKWYGPGLLWMISAVGSGSVLFTPRVGARYGYEFLWMALIFMFFMWVMIREVGRYTVVTGNTIFEGYRDISGSSNWTLYFILIPQMVAAVVTIAGIAALAGSTLMIAVPWAYEIYATGLILLCLVLVITGTYIVIERVTSVLAALLVTVVIVSAIMVFPDSSDLISGILPSFPEDTDVEFVIPWVGFILAGASGIMWFSYWVSARGYGGDLTALEDVKTIEPKERKNEYKSAKEDYKELKSWFSTMSVTAAIGVVGGGLILISFLILGTELLRPEGTIPEGITVAEDLTKLLSGIWGEAGRWFLIVGIMIALLGTILSNQDGYGRMFADGTVILAMPFLKKKEMIDPEIPSAAEEEAEPLGEQSKFRKKTTSILLNKKLLRLFYAIVFGAVLPIAAFFMVKDPVHILSIAGTIAAVHTPVVVFLTLHLNRTRLPAPVKPGKFITGAMWLSGISYAAFAIYHFTTL